MYIKKNFRFTLTGFLHSVIFTLWIFMLLLPRDVTGSTRFLQYTDGIKIFKFEYNSVKVLRCTILRVIPNNIRFFKVSRASPSCPSEKSTINPLKPELNPICYLLALLGAHHFLHVSRIRVKLLTLR